MRKGLIFILGIISFLGINTVSAKTLSFNVDNIDSQIQFYLDNQEYINTLYSYWEENYSSIYPYYYIKYNIAESGTKMFILSYSKTNETTWHIDQLLLKDYHFINLNVGISGSHDGIKENNHYNFVSLNNSYLPLIHNGIYFSDLDEYGNSYEFDSIAYSFPKSEYFELPIYTFDIKKNDIIPSIDLIYNGNFNPVPEKYIDIDLNDYAYVALSLKDYNTIPESNYSTYTNFYVKGQLCITPVYNYGQTERKDILNNTQVQGCSKYYNDFTLTRVYILKDDVKNHAIYYLKSYDTSKENVVKIDSSKFNITYITEEDKDNPQVNINGKIYPTLSYDSLTDTSTKSEDEGYLPGVSCALGDFNCYTENNAYNMFDNLFDKPLEMLKSVWGAIISIFELIAEFILLLPPTMQGFLYVAFAIAIILGIIKILL